VRVLITGALGFIGSHLAEEYLREGHTVIGLDNRSGNVVDRIDGMRGCWHTDARNIMSLSRCDLVVHAASPVGPAALLERHGIVAEIVETTQAAIRYCRFHGVPLVNISSSEVYGFSGVYHETDSCVMPYRLSHRIQYAAGKLAGEQLVRTSGLQATSIRPFNVAGPRQSREKGFVIPTFCEQALAGEPLTVFETGTQERCPTAVWDLVDFIVHNLAAIPAGQWPEVVNIGNSSNRTTVLDLAHLVLDLTGSVSDVDSTSGKEIHGPEFEEAEGLVKVPDTALANALGWAARMELDEMIERTLAEIQDRQGVA
jgi:nucleoside-diphosphate-sugar epimerase